MSVNQAAFLVRLRDPVVIQRLPGPWRLVLFHLTTREETETGVWPQRGQRRQSQNLSDLLVTGVPPLASAPHPRLGGPKSAWNCRVRANRSCHQPDSLLPISLSLLGLCRSLIWGTGVLSLKSRWRSSHFLLKPSSLPRKSNLLAAASIAT